MLEVLGNSYTFALYSGLLLTDIWSKCLLIALKKKDGSRLFVKDLFTKAKESRNEFSQKFARIKTTFFSFVKDSARSKTLGPVTLVFLFYVTV